MQFHHRLDLFMTFSRRQWHCVLTPLLSPCVLRHPPWFCLRSQAPGELGNFGQAWNPYPDNPVAFSKLQLKELKNGRLAMLAIMGKFLRPSSSSFLPSSSLTRTEYDGCESSTTLLCAHGREINGSVHGSENPHANELNKHWEHYRSFELLSFAS